ncbi:hypothetical protein M1247_06925 [Mycobacterium sp. 21AC1]|uniref:hypothetical protein n=1 Tax=[Mycobacterium] appelbergii TaxID=2939269 RepID=UPI0029391808|nr:hypothetical protein [Mycobacterium sp. 21AC1]MDV3124641.1 hypothetical protein [Mycobacterium sp. 21AC1]
MNICEPRKMKLLAAAAGGAAVVAFGVFGAVSGPQTTTVASSHMTFGQTSTETTPPTAPMVSMAVPTIKGPAPLPAEEKSAE